MQSQASFNVFHVNHLNDISENPFHFAVRLTVEREWRRLCLSVFPCFSFSIFHIFQLFQGDGKWKRKWCKKIKPELNGGSKYKTWKFQARLAVGFSLNFIYFGWQNWDAILLVYLVWDNLQFYTTSCPPICSFVVTTKIECLKWPKYGISTLPRLFVYK